MNDATAKKVAARLYAQSARIDALEAENKELRNLVKLAQFALFIPAIRDIRQRQLEAGNSAIADFEERAALLEDGRGAGQSADAA